MSIQAYFYHILPIRIIHNFRFRCNHRTTISNSFIDPHRHHLRFLSSFSPQQNLQSNLTITERCLKRIYEVLEPDELLRVGVRSGGCSGFEYEFSVERITDYNIQEDLLFEDRVVVDHESLKYLMGAKVDFENELIRSGFCITDNPLAEKNCSCGISFSLKMDTENLLSDVKSKKS